MTTYATAESVISQDLEDDWGEEVVYKQSLLMAENALDRQMQQQFGRPYPQYTQRVVDAKKSALDCPDTCYMHKYPHTHRTVYWDATA